MQNAIIMHSNGAALIGFVAPFFGVVGRYPAVTAPISAGDISFNREERNEVESMKKFL